MKNEVLVDGAIGLLMTYLKGGFFTWGKAD